MWAGGCERWPSVTWVGVDEGPPGHQARAVAMGTRRMWSIWGPEEARTLCAERWCPALVPPRVPDKPVAGQCLHGGPHVLENHCWHRGALLPPDP